MNERDKYARDVVALLDPVKLRNARIDAGITDSTLSGALGVAVNVIRSLEHGSDQCYLNLRFVRDLARALGVEPCDLFVDTTDPDRTAGSPDAVGVDDAATVGAVLAETAELTAVDTLASALGWTSSRTLIALDDLESRMVAVGQRLRWLHDSHVEVCAATTPEGVSASLSGRSVAENGLRRREVALLAELVERPLHRVADIDKLTLRRLRLAGLIETGVVDDPVERKAGGRNCEGARLTDTARFNLYLDP